ncbi:MAG TPA: RnfABCDGE type electron transport complex subunit D, partial [Rhodocyclaceae bacterium]|nr:RnfABCDGE type electron transport complex subunit D [Rhodocyclaceae bacterium]
MKPFNNDRAAPYTHAPTSVERTMREVMLALLPATAFGLYLFGWPAILLFAVTLAACVLVEALCAAAAGRPLRATLGDGSALLTGWLLALSLPPWAPWWIGVLGAVFAIALAKHAFGGLGQNIFNPAMVARVALLISFPVAMTAWVAPQPLFSADAPGFAEALEPIHMFALAYGYVFANPETALAAATVFVLVSQVKINVTNAYAGSLAWSNFFSRVTHYHPGRVVWLVFNILISLLLMLLGIFETLELVLAVYGNIATAWLGSLV